MGGALTLIEGVADRLAAALPPEQVELAEAVSDIPDVRPAGNIREINSSHELPVMPLVEVDGVDLRLGLVRADGLKLSALLGPAEAVALSADLLQVARVRFGRADWAPRKVA